MPNNQGLEVYQLKLKSKGDTYLDLDYSSLYHKNLIQ